MKLKLTTTTAVQRAMKTAEEGSLRHALVTQKWRYLWVEPLKWHVGHLELLQCAPPFTIPRSYGYAEGEPAFPFHMDLKVFHATLENIRLPGNKALMLRQLIKCLIQHKRQENDIKNMNVKREGKLVLHYGRDFHTDIFAHLIVRQYGNCPILAYIDWEWLRKQRSDPRFNGRILANERRNLYREHPVPQIPPFFVAVLIAMAQAQYYLDAREGGDPEDSDTLQVHLLCPNKDYTSLYRYSSDITIKYLMKFDHPYKFSDAPLKITKLEVPLDDLNSLGQMFEDILLDNVPFQFHPEPGEIFESPTPSPSSPPKYPSIDAILNMFNGHKRKQSGDSADQEEPPRKRHQGEYDEDMETFEAD